MTPIYGLKFYIKNWRLALRWLLRKPARISVGRFSYGAPAVLWWGERSGLSIGKFCSIAKNVTVFLGGNHRVDWVTTYPFNVHRPWNRSTGQVDHPTSRGDVVIGNDVWLGNGCTILSGISIGDGAVVAATATVTKDVPPYAIVAGNPARIVRYRFSEVEIARLQELHWWDWDENTIRAKLSTLLSSNVGDL